MADYIPSVTLNGKDMPAIGLGTWRSAPDVAKEAVLTALKNGYTHLDCAWSYQNEAIVGQAIVESGIPRDTLWITSKVSALESASELSFTPASSSTTLTDRSMPGCNCRRRQSSFELVLCYVLTPLQPEEPAMRLPGPLADALAPRF